MTAERHDPSSVEMRTFLNEALTMREFRHEHVLSLIGIVIDCDKMPLVILPFMTHGDLLSYIRDDNNVSRLQFALGHSSIGLLFIYSFIH